MPKGLQRFHHTGDWHFITCSCYRRQKFLDSMRRRNRLSGKSWSRCEPGAFCCRRLGRHAGALPSIIGDTRVRWATKKVVLETVGKFVSREGFQFNQRCKGRKEICLNGGI